MKNSSAEALEALKATTERLKVRTNVYTHSPEWMARIKDRALEDQIKFDGRMGAYNHNGLKSIMSGYMAELAIRNTYRYYDVKARMNMHHLQPDLTIPAIITLDGEEPEYHEEVKSWQLFNWERFGGTVKVVHAEKYLAKGRKRVWFCSCDVESGTVVIHGWLTPQQIIDCEIITTTGEYGGDNYNCEVLNRASVVFPLMEETDFGGGWW